MENFPVETGEENGDGKVRDQKLEQENNMNDTIYSAEPSGSGQKRIRQNCGDAVEDGEMNSKIDKNQSDAEAALHPLLIEHVVKKILSCFHWSYSNSDMLTFRQVCKSWCNIITNGMKRKGRVRQVVFKNDDLLPSFLADMNGTANFPFDSFEFDVHFFNRRNANAFREFLNSFSHCVDSVSLKIGRQYAMDLEQVLKHAEVNFDSLRVLSVECSHIYTIQDVIATKSAVVGQTRHPRDLAHGLLKLFDTIIFSAINLEEMNLHLPFGCLNGGDGTEMNLKFANIIANGLPDTVTNLNLTMLICENNLCALARMKLQKLHLNFYGSHLTKNALEDFIHSQSKTLTDLRLIDFENELSCFSFKDCHKVLRLTIKGESFCSLGCFPKLQTLTLLTEKNLKRCEKERGTSDAFFKTVSELCLKYPLGQPTMVSMPAYQFPNLMTLRIQVTPALESLRAIESVFQQVKTLEELEVTFLENFNKQPVDHILTGIPMTQCYIIGEYKMFSRQDQNRLFEDVVNRRPCLESLPNAMMQNVLEHLDLKRLIIISEAPTLMLTDVTAHYAFLRCHSLEEITFIGNHNISSNCFALLTARFRVKHSSSAKQIPNVVQPEVDNWALVPVLN